MNRVENFKSILDFNSLTRLEYLSQTSQLDSNTWVKNSDLNWVLTSRVLNLTWSVYFYHLHLSVSMKHLHSMFSLKLLQSYSEDSLSEQHSESFRLITIKDDEHWKIDDILNFRRYQDWIQYKVKWKDLDRNNEWYYVDKEKFDDSEKVLNEFHKLYSSKSR